MLKKILIFEDNETLRNGVAELLSLTEEFVVSGVYADCAEVVTAVKNHVPDVVLMDIDMPGISGIEAVRMIRKASAHAAIIMLTVFDDDRHVFDAICAGASGYLLKKNISERLVAAVREVLEGGAPMSPVIARKVISSMQQPATDYHFTEKEKTILSLLCEGNSYKMIAAQTGLTFETIRSYIKGIYEKLQVHSATAAVSKAINERLV
ncbi:MAG TPA: response regulator transcription factor [Niabella sp.]|nr:response regulator transcription factor [Niabella sp.]